MDQDEFQTHMIDGLARLETNMESLIGNGQPGRIDKIERKVDSLQEARWTLGGIYIGVSAAVGTAVHFIFKH